MQVTLIDVFKSARKKVCGHSDFYVFEKNGKTFTGRRCNKRTSDYSADEVAQHNKFKAASAAVDAILADAEQKMSALSEWQANPGKYTSLRTYLMAKELKKN